MAKWGTTTDDVFRPSVCGCETMAARSLAPSVAVVIVVDLPHSQTPHLWGNKNWPPV